MLDKLDKAVDALKQKSYEKVKVALESGTELVFKRVEAIKLADKSNLDGRPLTNICLTNPPPTPTTRREFTGPKGEPREKSIKRSVVVSVLTRKEAVPPLQFRVASSSRFSSKDLASRSEARPARRLGPCFKISSLLFLVILALFLLRRFWRYTLAIIQYSL